MATTPPSSPRRSDTSQTPDVFNQYLDSKAYVSVVSKKINEFLKSEDQDGLSKFVEGISQDRFYPDVLAKYPSLQLLEEPSGISSIRTNHLPVLDEEKAVESLYPDEEEYVQGVIEDAYRFNPVFDAEKLEVFVNQIQKEPHFKAVIARFPLLLQYLPPTEDASLVALALSKFVSFMREQTGDICSAERMAKNFVEFYETVAKNTADNPEVIAAALAACKECGYGNRFCEPIFGAIVDLLEGNGDSNSPHATKQIVNYYPCNFLGMPPEFQKNEDIICYILPDNPFLYYLLSQDVRQNRHIAEFAAKNGVSEAIRIYPNLALKPSIDSVKAAAAMFKRLVMTFSAINPPVYCSMGQVGLLERLRIMVKENYTDVHTLISHLEKEEGVDLALLNTLKEGIQEQYEAILGSYDDLEERVLNDSEIELGMEFGKPETEMSDAERLAYRFQKKSSMPLRKV